MARRRKKKSTRRSPARRARRTTARRSRRAAPRRRRTDRRRRVRAGCKAVTVKIKNRRGKVIKTFKAHKGPGCPKRAKPRLHRGMGVWQKAAKACAKKRGVGKVGTRTFTACMKKYVAAH